MREYLSAACTRVCTQGMLYTLPATEFERNRASFVQGLLDRQHDFGAEASELWSAIYLQQFDFDNGPSLQRVHDEGERSHRRHMRVHLFWHSEG